MRDLKSAGRESPADGRWLRLRVTLLGVTFLMLLAGVLYRAISLQIFERDRMRELAEDQYVRQIELPARRGDIFDRRGAPLAQSVEVDSIWIDPSMVPSLKATSRELAKRLKLDAAELQTRLSKAKRFAWVKRQASAAEVEKVKSLGLPAIGYTKEPKRFYPQRELAAHLIGMVGTDGRGLDGLELAFDDELSGQSSRVSSFRDARGRKLLTTATSVTEALERQGAHVTLTIDRNLQHLTERSLAKAVELAKASAGMALISDPRTGEILAMANWPAFNPNTPAGGNRASFKNRAALDTFEPGSTFKSFVVAGALEEKAIASDQIFWCENGSWDVGKHTIHDTHEYGWLTPEKILQVSSNICAAKIAQVLGREKMVEYYARFGFGERANLALPGEGKGVVPFPKAEISLATESFGQGLTATAVQIAAAYGALANGGVRMRPYLVSKVVDPDGVVLLENRPAPVKRVVSEATAKLVLQMLESVVEKEGTAPRAKLEDYRVAGKTGTAQKADPVARGYSDKRIASFVGVIPAEEPRAVILIVIDEPKTDVYGGLVAAPAFKEIAVAAMPYLGVAPSKRDSISVGTNSPVLNSPLPPPPLAARSGPLTDAFAKVEAASETVTEQLGSGTVRVPDLTGEAGRGAVSRLLGVALEPRLSGTGRVVSQDPPAGTLVEKGTRVLVVLAARQ
jgi:cell division protein FtsI (penicillin-binding protein 3)